MPSTRRSVRKAPSLLAGSAVKDDDPLMTIFGCGRISGGSSQHSVPGSHTRSGFIAAARERIKDDDDAGSLDLFSSQSSSQIGLNDQMDITLQLTTYVWVQCDNPDCQKWRRIPVLDSEDLGDDPWYCHMNASPGMNFCCAPEEDHAAYDRMARKAGIKYVMSILNLGAMVWAKMSGYCRWPALITKDPECGQHVMIDGDGDPFSYHVEYLGNPHSHSWISSSCVQVYGHKDLADIQLSPPADKPSSASYKKKCRRGRARGGGRIQTEPGTSKLRMSYKRIHIEDVVEEADFLLALSPEVRLNYTTFKYQPILLDSLHSQTQDCAKKRASRQCEKCGHSSSKKAKQGHQSTSNGRPHLHSNQEGSLRKVKQRRRKMAGKENEMKVNSDDLDAASLHGNQPSIDEGISVHTVRSDRSLNGLESPDQFSQSKLKFCNTMVDKTKEEMFTIDINIYKKNEKAFEHDVHRFMCRNGERIGSCPVWNDEPIRLFQLYLAVHERGGFLQVTVRKQWTAVYKEVTESHLAKNGMIAKKYYQRNLYPYELYMNGHDYKSAFSKETHKSAFSKETHRPIKSGQDHTTHVPTKLPQTVPAAASEDKEEMSIMRTRSAGRKASSLSSSPSQLLALEHDDKTSLAEDIEAILGRLEHDLQAGTKHNGKPAKKLKGLAIKYHDESESSATAGNVPSEFQALSFSDLSSEAQKVPDIDLSDCDSHLDIDLSDCDSHFSRVHSTILHEMKVLEKDMKEIAGELDL